MTPTTDQPLCPSCRIRPSQGPTEHTASGLKLCETCAYEGRKYGWD